MYNKHILYLRSIAVFIFLVFYSLIATPSFVEFKKFSRYYLLPHTTDTYLLPCSNFFNENKQFSNAIECSSKFIKGDLPKKLPECFIVSKDSPDISYDDKHKFNFINPNSFILQAILGFYDDTTETVYLVENTMVEDESLEDIYRHELNHYFLDLVYEDGDSHHRHPSWMGCFGYPET